MSSIRAIYWMFFITKLVVPVPLTFPPTYDLRTACYDREELAPNVQQNVENLDLSAACLLRASKAQIILWPTETHATSADNAPETVTPASSGIVSNGVTFVSPSVYIAYHGVQAFTSCPTTGYIARGKAYNTTIAYAPEEFSVSVSARAHQACTLSETNYRKLTHYSFWNATNFIFSIPRVLVSVEPAWSTCAPATCGSIDPLHTMPRATALTSPATRSISSTPAAPGSSVRHAQAPDTTTSATTRSTPRTHKAVPSHAGPRTTNPSKPSTAVPARSSVKPVTHCTTTSSTSEAPKAAPSPAVPVTTNPSKPSTAVPARSLIIPVTHDTAVSEGPSSIPSKTSQVGNTRPDQHNSTYTSLIPPASISDNTTVSGNLTYTPPKTTLVESILSLPMPGTQPPPNTVIPETIPNTPPETTQVTMPGVQPPPNTVIPETIPNTPPETTQVTMPGVQTPPAAIPETLPQAPPQQPQVETNCPDRDRPPQTVARPLKP